MDDGTLQVRSYRVCFDLERRIHKLDRWRIPLPYGLPVRGMLYAGASLITVLILLKLPLSGALLSSVHPAVRFVVLPIAAAMALTQWSVDGRPAHAVGISWLRLKLTPRRLSAFRPAPPCESARLWEIPIGRDETQPTLRRGVVEGPSTVVLRYPARVQVAPFSRTLGISQQPGPAMWRGKQIRLEPGQRVLVK